MLGIFVGKMGAGKTCMMTYTAYLDWRKKQRNVLANYRLKFPHQPLDLRRMLDASDRQINKATLAIDEIWLFFDSRASQKKQNRLISHVLLQSRKRDVDVYGTSQSFKQVDARFRQNCDYVVLMAMRKDTMFPRVFNRDTGRWTKLMISAKPIFSLYDTDELIDPRTIEDRDEDEGTIEKELPSIRDGLGAHAWADTDPAIPTIHVNPVIPTRRLNSTSMGAEELIARIKADERLRANMSAKITETEEENQQMADVEDHQE